MAKALSTDLRSRVISAVEAGMSRHAAAVRFGISASSAIRWVAAWQETGQTAGRRQGGDRRSHRIEAHGATILTALEGQVDLTLTELAALVYQRHGIRFAPSSIWRFLDRHGLSIKKNRACRRAGAPRRRSEASGLARGAA